MRIALRTKIFATYVAALALGAALTALAVRAGGPALAAGAASFAAVLLFVGYRLSAYIADEAERRRAREEPAHPAYHDPLTGLPNRRRFHEQLARTLHAPDRGGMRAAVLLLGLDRLDVIIGGLGHGIGDGLLQAVTARLEQVLARDPPPAGQVSLFRFGGDEFALLIPGFTRGELPIRVAETVIEAMRAPLYVSTRELFLTFSIGISVFPLDGQDVVTLLRNADTAMRRARALGGNALQCYSADMNARAAEWLTLENHLRHAEEYGELRLYYQPQVDARTGKLLGAEALLRWQHPDRGLVPPAEFIPIAEDAGIVVAIGEWALRGACAQARDWAAAGLDEITVAVNISARQFQQHDLPQRVAAILRETGLPARRLELEITEGVAMRDVARTTATLERLKDMGVRLSIDDFGTGFSSLSYLKRFPIDKLKIDQSFVRNLTCDENDAAITRAVITLGHSLKLSVVAEGVETEQQLARLRADGCDAVQGHLVGRPMPAEAFARRFREAARIDLG